MVISMKKYLRIIKNNLQSVFSIGNLGCTIAIFIYLFAVNFKFIDYSHKFREFIEIIFMSPINLTNNIIQVFTWILYQFFLIYMIGNYFFKELATRSIYVIPRLRNKQYWHICLQITAFLVCIIYFALGIFISFICGISLNKTFNLNNAVEIFKIIMLLGFSSYYLVTVYIFSTLITRKHNLSFLLLIITACLSNTLGTIFRIDKYLPFNQGLIIKHMIYKFSYQWSLIFLTILIFINLIFINRFIVKKDLFEITH